MQHDQTSRRSYSCVALLVSVTLVFLAPGLQFAMDRWVIEASLQLPVVQELSDGRPEDDFRLILGLRFQW